MSCSHSNCSPPHKLHKMADMTTWEAPKLKLNRGGPSAQEHGKFVPHLCKREILRGIAGGGATEANALGCRTFRAPGEGPERVGNSQGG